VRSRVEHVFAAEKRHMGLVVRTIGLLRATAKIALANLAYNLRRLANGARTPDQRPATQCIRQCSAAIWMGRERRSGWSLRPRLVDMIVAVD
jgi:hypothetical protein